MVTWSYCGGDCLPVALFSISHSEYIKIEEIIKKAALGRKGAHFGSYASPPRS